MADGSEDDVGGGPVNFLETTTIEVDVGLHVSDGGAALLSTFDDLFGLGRASATTIPRASR